MTTLQLRNVSASPWKNILLQDINLSLEPGAILGLAGPNGAGKSTLLNLITGDIGIDAGSLLFINRPLHEWPLRERARNLAALPQMSLLNFPYTVEEVILLGRIPHDTGRARDREIVNSVMEFTDTTTLRDRLYTQLSGGEKQRTQLARAFAQVWDEGSLQGKLLLLDEPTSALDLAHQQQMLSTTRLLAQRGCTVVLVIHDLNLAASIADQILVLDQGQQIALGSPGEVFTPALFRQVFHVEIDVGRHPRQGYPVITPLRADLP